MAHLLEYRAGPQALEQIRRSGLQPGQVGAMIAPASGPKWLVLDGIDRALLADGWLDPVQGRRVGLYGASAGAWRAAALAGDPGDASVYGRLAGLYTSQVFTNRHTPGEISAAYRKLLDDLLPGAARDRILNQERARLVVHVCRGRGLLASRSRVGQGLTMVGAGLLNFVVPATGLVAGRIQLSPWPDGTIHPLDQDSLVPALLASGTLPLYMQPVQIPGLPGAHLDGGLTDYNLAIPPAEPGIILFPHYRSRIAPAWLDKFVPWRSTPAAALSRVLQIYPSDEFVRVLPGQQIPDRQDFKTWMNDPQERMRRWTTTVDLAQQLGRQFRDDVQSGQIAELVKPIGRN